MRPITFDGVIDGDVRTVAALFTDEAFLRGFVADVGATQTTMNVSDTTAALTWQVPTKKFPSFLRPFVGPEVPVDESIAWSSVTEAKAEGPYRLSIKVAGQTGDLNGTATLVAESAASCRYRIDGTIAIQLPFIGTRAEEAAEPPLLEILEQRVAFANSWLRAHPAV